ncbi:hypothetical protein EMPS_02131 [Entomortierella parvispora]|uniref:C2H2-type domain-containing protein n=1 Tax=Entomortierella parvispora TaxID=205924 RepID=A0A9P3H470_9FUNG|nr:hypothetical protein EMPS_02131 [Entomortierella parvispora]
MPKDYYGRGDYSDDDSGSRGRDKFRRERSPEKDDFGRDKRRRKVSASPDDRERRPKRNRSTSKDGGDPSEPGDRYIPNYDRDRYNPAPRYRPEGYGGRYDGPGGYGDYRGGRRRDDYDLDGPDYGGDMPPSGWNNHDAVEDPMKLDYLMSFKQYCEHVRNMDRASHRFKRYSDEELQTRYGTYREEYTAKQLAAFYEKHMNEAWFQEKYHPEKSRQRQKDARALRRSLFEKFVVDLAAGKYDTTTCDEARDKKINGVSNDNKTKASTEGDQNGQADEDGDITLSEATEDGEMLYLRTILPDVSRESIIERCYKIKGFLDLSLSEPHPLKDLERTGWIKFEKGTDIDNALKVLSKSKDWQASTSPHRATRPRYTHEIANSEARLRADLELIKSLVKVCDQAMIEKLVVGEPEPVTLDGTPLLEARLADHILATTESQEGDQEEGSVTAPKIADVRQSLDLYIEYLRQVHLFCYYCGGDSDNVEEFHRKCSKHYRNPEPKAPVNSTKGPVWVKNLENKINLRLKAPTDDEIVKLGGKSIERNVLKFLQGKTQQDDTTKWRCKICTKPFRGEEFVHKHIRTKHPDEVKEVENKLHLFNNYILDPNHINPAAQQQPPPISNGFGFGGPGPMFSNPMPISFMPGSHPVGMPPFMNPGAPPMFTPGFIPPSFQTTGAMPGTPLDQIPRIGFGRGPKDENGPRITKPPSFTQPPPPPGMALDPRSKMTDPRKVKSYVDLDAPAEGDIDAKYNLW